MFLFRKNEISENSDEDLLREYRFSGNKEIIAALFKRYANKILGACAFYFEDKEKSKDAVMQIFQKLMEELKKKEINNFRGWLSFVVRNHCISELRKEKSSVKKHAAFYEFEYEMPDEEEEKKISLIKDEQMLQYMHLSISRLKEFQRKCVSLFYLQRKSYQEISLEMGCSLNEVKSHIQNGKRKLKLMIEEYMRSQRINLKNKQ